MHQLPFLLILLPLKTKIAMYLIILLGVLYFSLPVVIIHLCRKYVIFDRIGTILLAYMVGLIIGNAGIIPAASDALLKILPQTEINLDKIKLLVNSGKLEETDLLVYRVREFQELMTIITIPLALPLLLFASNFQRWAGVAGKSFLSMALALFSVVMVVSAGHLLFRDKGIDELWKVSGLMIGLYSGGTPNLAALKLMLDVKSETYILTHTYDTVVSAAYLFFLITIGKNVFKHFLPAFRRKASEKEEMEDHGVIENHFLGKIFKRKSAGITLKTLLFAILIFGIAGLLSIWVDPEAQMLVVILTITTLSILVSIIPRIRISPHSFSMGMYFILVFSIVVASMADFKNFASTGTTLFYFVCFAIFASLFMHVLLSRLFKIDADTVMVTSTALICSPPFVPMIAGAVKNKEVIVSGITVGIIGYAIGNYLGVAMAYFLNGL